jgi:predicted transcriptional regulator
MRTTLEIDDDVLEAAKELAKAQKTTAGQVISDLARQALTRASGEPAEYRNGFRLLPRAGKIITSEMVERWLEEDV